MRNKQTYLLTPGTRNCCSASWGQERPSMQVNKNLRPQYPLLGFCFRVVLLLSTMEFVTIFTCFQGFNANQSFSILTFVGVYLGYANMIDRILSSGGISGEVRFGCRKKRCPFFGGFILQVVLQNLAHLITFIEG